MQIAKFDTVTALFLRSSQKPNTSQNSDRSRYELLMPDRIQQVVLEI
ncbi:hypothetical protein QUB05_27335 [Microcoleus sp. F10-C6]